MEKALSALNSIGISNKQIKKQYEINFAGKDGFLFVVEFDINRATTMYVYLDGKISGIDPILSPVFLANSRKIQ